jgi:hypothetical protein
MTLIISAADIEIILACSRSKTLGNRESHLIRKGLQCI